jgi:hypothetical protein
VHSYASCFPYLRALSLLPVMNDDDIGDQSHADLKRFEIV